MLSMFNDVKIKNIYIKTIKNIKLIIKNSKSYENNFKFKS